MKFERIHWCTDAEVELVRALDDADDIDFIRSQVRRNQAALWRVDSETYFVVRVEGRELVVVAFAGLNLLEVSREIVRTAWSKGCHSIRFHTHSLAVIRMMREFDPVPVEYVVRVINHGRRKEFDASESADEQCARH